MLNLSFAAFLHMTFFHKHGVLCKFMLLVVNIKQPRLFILTICCSSVGSIMGQKIESLGNNGLNDFQNQWSCINL